MPWIVFNKLTGQITMESSNEVPSVFLDPDTECKFIDRQVNARTHRLSKDRRVIPKRSSDIEDEEISQAWQELRRQRLYLLAASDVIVTRAAEQGQTPPQPWVEYRQALRDLPRNTKDPRNPTWPEQPQ